MKIAGDLEILTAEDARKYADVTEVGGWLSIIAAGVSLPALTEVSGWLIINAAGASLPLLAKVGGYVDITAAGVSLPALTSVGGWLSIIAAGVSLPALTEVSGWLYITAEAASLPKLAVEHAFYGWSLRRHINTGMWYAGCRGPWTTDEALAHWGERDDKRARLFCAAIVEATA